MQQLHLWAQHSGAVTGYVLLTSFVEVALGVLVHTGLTVAALGGRPSRDLPLRARARGRARRRALAPVRRRPGLADGGTDLFSLDPVGCFHDSHREGHRGRGAILEVRNWRHAVLGRNTH